MPSNLSVISICNGALMKIGAERITSLSDGTKGSDACNDRYEIIRDEVLSAHPWNCALKRVELSVSATAPEYGYDNAYPLPNDCLRVLQMEYPDMEFKIEDGSLLTDEDEAYITYIFQQTDPTKFSPLLAQAIEYRLAKELAILMQQNFTLADLMERGYQMTLRSARTVDAQEGSSDSLVVDDWINARS